MDLRLFRPPQASPDEKFPMMDRLNSWTGLFACRYLEWTGWYNYKVSMRLLGHYRLFQHYRKAYVKARRDLPAARAYILQYRSSNSFKYLMSRVMAFIYSIFTWKDYFPVVEIAVINRQLVRGSSIILEEFLNNADADFAAALTRALEQIDNPVFYNPGYNATYPVPAPAPFFQFNQQNNTYHEYNNQHNTFNHNEINIQPVLKDGAKGKEKGIFSKKQILILFDLLADGGKMERIDFSKPGKFSDIADLLHAITSKAKDSFVEELNDYRHKKLYEFNTEGELRQLISTLSNLSEICRKAGFRTIATLADRKIRELESMKKDW